MSPSLYKSDPICRIFGILAAFLVFCAPVAATHVLFVSQSGNDAWSGELAEPTQDGSNGPLATLQAAQLRVRHLIANPDRAREAIIINLRGGTYPVESSLNLGERDGGISTAPITWQAYPGETVILDGGTRVTGFKTVADAGIATRVPEPFWEKVYVARLSKKEIRNLGELKRQSMYDIELPGPLQLFYEDRIMTLARYPNQGWVRIADVPQKSGTPIREGHHADRRDGTVPTGRHYGAITYAGDRPASWAPNDDIWLHGYWTWDWADSTQRLEKLDTATRYITLAEPHHRYGYTTGQRFYYFNIPEELDSPGEWYLDRESRYLYFWPPDEAFDGECLLSRYEKPVIQVSKSQHLTIRGFDFAYGRGAAIRITDSETVAVDACRFYCLGGRPVTIEEGRNCGVSNSVFSEISTGAVFLSGGDRATLEPAGHYVVNNHIHDFSSVFRTNHPALRIFGVGNRAAHNLIHDAPHMALLFKGNDHLIEYNEIHDIAKETGDVGAIYIGRDYTSRGSIIRYNYLHHLHGPGLHGVRGVYLDDFSSGIEVFGNVFYQAGRAAFIGGGRNNRIQNNLFIECQPSVQIDGRGLSWARHHFDEDSVAYASTLRDKYAEARVTEPPYAQRYPELQFLYQDEPKVPKYNVIENNLSFEGIFLDLYDGVDLKLATVRHNLIADPVAVRMTDKSDQDPDFTVYKYGETKTSKFLEDNVLREFNTLPYRILDNHVHLDFASLPEGTGFLPIPFHLIGLQPTGQ